MSFQLTGDLEPTSGSASLHGFDILSHPMEAQQLLGYCPQYDALLPELTARETLELFARLRSVAEDVVPNYVEQLLQRIDLQEGQADRPCCGYSGGNKRKLCLGIALVGNPAVVFLSVMLSEKKMR
jgi:ABC-type multidrug transport system ATPase subunit